MYRMTEPLWVTGKMLITYIGFYVLKGLIGMYEIGLYGSAVVKKHIYWSAGIYGD